MKDVDIYAAADRAIREANREIVQDFGRLKTSKFDEVHVIQAVTRVYREQVRKLRRRYYEVGFEAYLLGLYLCGIDGEKAHRMAEKAVTMDWVDERLEEIDLTAGYRFNRETERKAQRLIEALVGAAEADTRGRASGGGRKRPQVSGTDAEIDRAMKAWSRQAAHFAISITDSALMDAYEDAGEESGTWISERDSRVCADCKQLDGKVFKLKDIPPKPHLLCRCKILPGSGIAEDDDGDSKPGKR